MFIEFLEYFNLCIEYLSAYIYQTENIYIFAW